MSSEILPFYSNCNVLITGGTGLLGSMVAEKLLRVCDDIQGIYLIIRGKKGKTTEERLEALCKEVVFNRLRELKPDFSKKIRALEGDVSSKGLGLSQTDRKLVSSKINVVFHCAASLNMESKLDDAVKSNIGGVSEMLDLCREMSNLKSVVFVSTAYSNCVYPVIEERSYPSPIQQSTLVKLTEEVDENVLTNVTPGLLGKWPNTYCYTKAVGESVVFEKGTDVPAAIFRPSIVTNAFAEPMPGFVSNVYGPIGMMVACGTGLMRTWYLPAENHFDSVPADFCVNSMICSAWEINRKWKETKGKRDASQIPIYNCCAGPKKSMTWGNFNRLGLAHEFPFSNRLWVATMTFTKCKYHFALLSLFLHYIPAFLIDTYARLKGKRPRLMKTHKKIAKAATTVNYFANREWNIINKNIYKMWDRLNEHDKKMFPFNMNVIEEKEYVAICCLGLKLYVMKETLDNAKEEQALYKKQMRIHNTVKTILKVIFILVIARVLCCILLKFKS